MTVPTYARATAQGRSRTGNLWFVLVALAPLLAMAAVPAVWYVRGDPTVPERKRLMITGTRPADRDVAVVPTAFIAADVQLPHAGHGIDSRTISDRSVRLYRTDDGTPVPASVNTSGGGDALTLTPKEPLDQGTRYTFEVTRGLRDTGGYRFRPYKATFTTARGVSESDYPVAFEKVSLGSVPKAVFTTLEFGPDGRLYAGTFDGRILRFGIRPDGTLGDPDTIATVVQNNHGPRLITGIRFDPASTADAPILWVSHGVMKLEDVPDWTGKISRLTGPQLGGYQDVIVGLPRSHRDHLNNQLDFGPDGAIYFNQASMTACGAPDKKWNYRHEHLLSSAILRLDPRLLPASLPVDVKTEDGGRYNPFAPNAPLTLYATGIRVAFDVLWTRSGRLYAPINGSARGGNAPASPDGKTPALYDISTQDDYLFLIERGGYYGHPNPSRNQYVLNGGNPTEGPDPAEVFEYPVGVKPEPAWRGFAYDFGKSVSPNGVLEYHGPAFGGLLDGKLLVCRYSGGDDIAVLSPGPDGRIVEAVTGIEGFRQFVDPLDIVEDVRSGFLYVAEFSGQKLTLLRPMAGATTRPSSRVFRQIVAQAP